MFLHTLSLVGSPTVEYGNPHQTRVPTQSPMTNIPLIDQDNYNLTTK